ncbi:MAG TPA: tRNA preQ1(34) S-adenosylmethionine ribosyltransferase-isomerase QueA [Candidatus Acidoferrum sp.]|nr:tRNA preQ1(34) S-adenosylmethionine ribosyltransferase-isomerase QueA [Candidatus Acidoferrum sp.]
MNLADFDYGLPPELIAQRPLERRDSSRMLLLPRIPGNWEDRLFADLPAILRGDELLIVNNARVIPARLFGRRVGVHAQTPAGSAQSERLSGRVEVFITKLVRPNIWEALVRPGRKMQVGERVLFGDGELEAEVVSRGDLGLRTLQFVSRDTRSVSDQFERLGHVPLPPYIQREDEKADRERYQTIYAAKPGAIAAPTAGLHFTGEILERIRARGVEICELTLDVGLGTFQPVHAEVLEDHVMHEEAYEIPEETAAKVRRARKSRRPILAVGTTVVRALEAAALRAVEADGSDVLLPGKAAARLFIYPGFQFRIVDSLLTNFHLPRSTLLALVAAFAGRENILAAYCHAVEARYRFYSYGDCMLIR